MVPNNEGQESETEDGAGLKGTLGDRDRQILFWGFFAKKNWLFRIVETLPKSETTRRRNFSRRCSCNKGVGGPEPLPPKNIWQISYPIQTRGQIMPLTLLCRICTMNVFSATFSYFNCQRTYVHKRSSGTNFGHKDEFRLFAKETDKHFPKLGCRWCRCQRIDRIEGSSEVF